MTDRSHILPEHDVRPYSVAQLADRWGCSGNVVRKLINQGELACFRIGTLIRIPAAEVARFEAQASTSAPLCPPEPPPPAAENETPAFTAERTARLDALLKDGRAKRRKRIAPHRSRV